MRITLTGASGFIGSRLIAKLSSQGHALHVLGRRRPPMLPTDTGFSIWDATAGAAPPDKSLHGCEALIHMAGEPVAQRWTAAVKERIRTSRVNGTKALVDAIAKLPSRPRCFICASAIGYYGDRGEEVLSEESSPGTGFLPDICVAWEHAAREAEGLGVRTASLRLGVVLGLDGGALGKMVTPFRLGVGGRVGNGQQWMSWIHADDVVGLFLHALDSDLRGPMNLTAPEPVRNAAFTKALGKALHRPTIFPVPRAALRLAFGEMASMLIGSQRVDCAVARRLGYRFQYPEINAAMADLFR